MVIVIEINLIQMVIITRNSFSCTSDPPADDAGDARSKFTFNDHDLYHDFDDYHVSDDDSGDDRIVLMNQVHLPARRPVGLHYHPGECDDHGP